jgi:formylglycine-generating enzyme required for sulfatase activity
MSVVPTSQGLGGSYCIDDFEVTKAAYTLFNSANPVLILPTQCGSNPDYTPTNDWPAILTQIDYNGGEPVHYVNWCDAIAYCQYSNKHLCGAISGGAQDPTMANVFQTDAWYNACSAKGNNTWPYGSPYQSQWCNGADLLINGITAEVDYSGNNQELLCQGGESFVYYMSGNVAEWENACDTASPPNCLARGGSYVSNSTELECTAAVSYPSTTTDPTIGFRCCE